MKKIFKVFLSLVAAATLSSCSLYLFESTNTSSTTVPSIPDIPDTGDGYIRYHGYNYNLQDVDASIGKIDLPSKGEPRILVVPVQLKGERSWTNVMLENLQKGFFGSADETGWQSVSSFYEASSYGKLKIKGDIATPLKSTYTPAYLLSNDSSGGQHRPDIYIESEFQKSTSYDTIRKASDTNNDGYIDSTVFVYSTQISSSQGYWAWATYGDSSASTSRPSVNSYIWVSYDFFVYNSDAHYNRLYAGYGSQVDAHTIIHESGHLLGLDDYYCYDDNGWDPSGKIEMHSNNIGDENAYSKFALGWIDPFYINGSSSTTTITLRSSAEYGDAILIKNNWNKTALDEYILIEYYTPDGMNKKDAISKYPGNGLQMYTESGFRIYHIDARTVELSTRGEMIDYANYSKTSNKFYAVGASNSELYSHLNNHAGDFKQVHLLEAGGTNTFKNDSVATNATLFQNGDSFTANANFFFYENKFNDGTEMGYNISVGECSEYQGTVSISQL